MQVNTKSKKSHIIKSYAKVNIGLNIIDKMQNGYHEIETLIQQVDFYDTIEIKIGSQAGDVIFSTSGNAINCENEKNSCVMITKLLRQKFKIYNNITIKLHKNIPIGAGLGGGSSNAAAILNFMNYYFKLNLDYNKKVNLCQTIGMDAPFFIDGKLQYAENMGEQLSKLPSIFKSYYFLLVYPKIIIPTQWAYLNIKKQLPIKKLNYNLLALKAPLNWSVFENDFEEVVIPRYPEIGEIKQKMIEYNAIYSSLSGSGSTVFGIYETLEDVLSSREKIKKSEYQTIVAKPV